MEPPKTGNFNAVKLPQPDSVRCRCFGVIDLGTVDNTYPGQETVRARKVIIAWEMPDLKAVFDPEKGEQPFIITEEYKYSTHKEANLAKLISAWRNRALGIDPKTGVDERLTFDPTVMVNKIGLMSFQHKRKKAYRETQLTPDQITNENTSLVLNAIGPLPAPMKEGMSPMLNEPIVWDWDKITKHGESFDQEKFSKIYKWIRKKIYTSDEFKSCPTAVNIDDNSQQAASQPQASSQPEQGDVGGDGWD